ncbi:hypothetical protein N9Z86_00450 [bacterium]|nr:hypothetical protein [bacterium]
MPIVEFSNLNKYGNIRTRRFYQEKSNLSINPEGFGPSIMFKLFKYDYEGHTSPGIINLRDKTYLVPIWQEVIKGTTLNDINWLKPKIKVKEQKQNIIVKSPSSSSNKIYTTTFYTDSGKFYCDCPGRWRALSGKCKHIKSLEKKVNK